MYIAGLSIISVVSLTTFARGRHCYTGWATLYRFCHTFLVFCEELQKDVVSNLMPRNFSAKLGPTNTFQINANFSGKFKSLYGNIGNFW